MKSRKDSLTGSPKKGGFQLLDTEFIRDTFGYSNRGVMSDRRNNSKGVQIATNVDLSQWSEEEFIQLDLPGDLIEKLAPYLGRRGMEAAQALKTCPLEITWSEADILSKAAMKYWTKFYGKVYDDSVRSIKGKRLQTWFELDVHVRTIIYTVLQQVPSYTSVPAFWNHVTRQHWKHVFAEVKLLEKQDLLKKGGESDYFNEYLRQENLLNEKNGSKMVTLQLPDITSGISRSMENLNASPSVLKCDQKHLSSLDVPQSEFVSRASIGSPVPPMGFVHMRNRSRSPTISNQLQLDNFRPNGSIESLSTSHVKSRDKAEPNYPNQKLDHLGRRQRSSSIQLSAEAAKPLQKLVPPGFSEVTVVDDITVMHKPPLSKASSGAYSNSSPMSGSPRESRRGSINSDLPGVKPSHSTDRRNSFNVLLPPLDASLTHNKSNGKIRSLNNSPVVKRRSKMDSFNNMGDENGMLSVPSFTR